MKLKKDSVLARALTGVVAIAAGTFMLGFAAVPAQADHTVEHQIEQLLAQIATLQAQLNAGSGSSGLHCDFTFTRDLSVGSTGADVMDLQKFLNSVDGVQVAASGVGSAGNETSYYGTLTAQAVSAFHVKYSSEILAPLGLTSGTGYFGQSSRAKATQLCAAAPAPDTGDDDEPADDGDDDLSGGEGSITDYDALSKFDSEDVSEGETETVFGFDFEADGSDISVRRVDVAFEAKGSPDAAAEPWDFFEEVNLYHGDDQVASMTADDEDDWEDITSTNIDGESDEDMYRMRFSGLSEVVREDDNSEWSLEVVVRDVVDSNDDDQSFVVAVVDDGIRAVDAAGINIYGGSDTETSTFTVDAPTAGKITVSGSDDFDDPIVVQLDDENDTDDVTVGMFEIEAEEGDVTIEDLPVDLAMTVDEDIEDLVTSLSLYADGDLIESKSVTGNTSGSTTITFDDIDYEIEEDDIVTFTVMADLQELDDSEAQGEGDSFYVAVFGAEITAEDANGEDATLNGNWNINGDDDVTVYTKLPQLTVGEKSATRSDDGSGNYYDASYEIVFSVEAEGGDIYIPISGHATTSDTDPGTSSNSGVEVYVEGLSNDTASSSGITVTLQSDADDDGTYYIVDENESEEFTILVQYDNENATNSDFYRAVMTALNWDITDQDPDFAFTTGLDNYKTGQVFLDN
ncbi:MAG: hypothetical protein WDZ70_00615 [Candidatus Paceibacterota bacterium]